MCLGLVQLTPTTGCLCLWSGAQAEGVHLVCFVYLVDLVHLISLVQPNNKTDQTNQINRRNQLGKVECDLNGVCLKLRKQSLCLEGVVGILGLGLVVQNRLEKILGNVNLSCYHGSGAGP